VLAPRFARGQSDAVGFFDKAKALLGIDQAPAKPESGRAPSPQPRERKPERKKDGRPPLPEIDASPSATLEDALAARERGAKPEARAILAAIDKGRGLRTVLRAAAALEAGDEAELGKLAGAVAAEEPVWQLPLQVAASLADGPKREALVREAARLGAPRWSLAWVDVGSADPARARTALVELLFEDAALARTVAARDLGLSSVKVDHDAVRRYASFAHGRDSIKRFGADEVSRLLERAGAR
jgi:hypothetical protein